MSDTPETDALVAEQEEAFGMPGGAMSAIVSAKFARERRVEEAARRVAGWYKAGADNQKWVRPV